MSTIRTAPLVQVLPAADMRELVLRLPCEEVLSVDDRATATALEEIGYLEDVLGVEIDAARTGATVRGLLTAPACASPYDRRYYDAVDAAGAEHRVLRAPTARFILLDRSLAIVDADVDGHVLLIRAPGAVAAIHGGFEAMWAQSLARRPPRRGDGDDDRILDLLAEGRTDAAAGRVLGVSERTVRRRVTALMDRHGARSRYELGLMFAAGAETGPPEPGSLPPGTVLTPPAT